MAKYDYVLLDADNTLFDFDYSEKKALGATLTHYGYPMSQEHHQAYHQANKALWKSFERGEITQEEILARRFGGFMELVGGDYDPAAMNEHFMDQLIAHGRLLPGAEDFCRSLHGRCNLVIVTNGVARVQRGRLERSPIRELFAGVFISTELGCQKPSKAYFDEVCRALPLPDRKRAIVVGDSLTSDILGGHNAGIDTIWYNPEGQPWGEIVPTWEARNYMEALKLIL
ncbi:MAG: 5-nucleotidase YjjG [Firmicutes bacterium]|nr:5-nucleotidase YjjG [Bacillota bacterium]